MRETMLFLHFIGLSMGLGVSFAHAFLGFAVAKMNPDEALKFRMHTLALGRMGHIGTLGRLTLIVSLTIVVLAVNIFH